MSESPDVLVSHSLQSAGIKPKVAHQLILITGATYAVAVLETIRAARRQHPNLVERLQSINPAALLSVPHLNRYLRSKKIPPVAVHDIPSSARVATRVYNGLRFLAQLEPFPDGS